MNDARPIMPDEPIPSTRRRAASDRYIPIRKRDVVDALVAHGAFTAPADADKFRRLCAALAAIYHHEFFVALERLRDDYYYFSPDRDDAVLANAGTLALAHDELVATLAAVLVEANFVEIPRAEIEAAHREHHLLRVTVETPIEDFRDVLFFRRGEHSRTEEIREWFGLRRRKIEVTVYDHVMLMVMIKPDDHLTDKQRKRLARAKLQPGSILIKYFRDICRSDLDMLFPNVRVVMSLFDKLALGVPAIAGGIPILLNLLPTFAVLFVVLGFFLGFTAHVEDDDQKKALAALSGLGALGAFMVRQWTKYQRQTLKYHKAIADNVYFRNLNNNAGIFDYLIGAAEEQETKEAFLAYYFLATAGGPLDQMALEQRIESWLAETFRVPVDFEIDDALAKLDRLQLLRRDGANLTAVALDEALAALAQAWARLVAAPMSGFDCAAAESIPRSR